MFYLCLLLAVTLSSVSSTCPSCYITRSGNVLYEQMEDGEEEVFTFSGVNIYWLGNDANAPDIPDGVQVYTHPSQYRVDDVLMSALSMGSRVVRSFTLGISTGSGEFHCNNLGWEGTVWPERGVTREDNFISMDYAVFRAGELGLRLVVPLTNEWNNAAGGIQDFLGWRGKDSLEGVEDNCVDDLGQHKQDEFFTDPEVIADFKEYVSVILNHVNPFTGLAYKDDPTIMAWESGNELYYPTYDWTVSLARYIKEDVGSQQLFMDGRMVSETSFYPELEDPILLAEYKEVVDIISDHLYPIDPEKLEEVAGKAKEFNIPFIVGEFGWTNKEEMEYFLVMLEQLKADGMLSGSLFWSMLGHAEQYGHVTHDDGFSIYWPTGPEPESFHHNNVAYRNLMKNFSDHMFRMSSKEVPITYLMSDLAPLVTVLECKPGQWVRVAFRGVAGAHLYKVVVDGHALGFIEDRQSEPTFIHTDVVQDGSMVQVLPYGYGDSATYGTPSEEFECPPLQLLDY